MDRPDRGQEAATGSLPIPRRVGFIGKGDIEPYDIAQLWYIGRCIAKLGHTLVIVPADGAANAIRRGVEAEGGAIEALDSGVIESSAHTLIYPDTRLLERLRTRYPDIEERKNVTIIREGQLDGWFDAMKVILTERGINLPG